MTAKKGSAFEREVCKLFSLWWTEGEEDDVFWRSSQSGGRATQRAKKGKSTYGSCGDIAAVNPVGLPFLQLFTIELKRGRSHGDFADLLDKVDDRARRPFEEALLQAQDAAQRAGSVSWLLICRRDRRIAMVYGSADVLKSIGCKLCGIVSVTVGEQRVRLGIARLDSFLKITPAQVLRALKDNNPVTNKL